MGEEAVSVDKCREGSKRVVEEDAWSGQALCAGANAHWGYAVGGHRVIEEVL